MRREDWQVKLFEIVEAAQDQPYQLGTHDCLKFSCACIEAMTGVDHWPAFAGLYGDKREALKLIAQFGRSFADAVSGVLGKDPQPVLMAQRGDLMMYHDDSGDHLGICCGATIAVLAEDGLHHVPLTHHGLTASWRIE
jgi:cell wall-associated NlpC family hydrolase